MYVLVAYVRVVCMYVCMYAQSVKNPYQFSFVLDWIFCILPNKVPSAVKESSSVPQKVH